MILAATTAWYLAYVMAVDSPQIGTIGPMNTERDCKFAEDQIVKWLEPKRHHCIEIPAYQQGNGQ